MRQTALGLKFYDDDDKKLPKNIYLKFAPFNDKKFPAVKWKILSGANVP